MRESSDASGGGAHVEPGGGSGSYAWLVPWVLDGGRNASAACDVSTGLHRS